MGQWFRSFQTFLPFALALVGLWVAVGVGYGRLDERRRARLVVVLGATWLFAVACLTLTPQGPRLDAEGQSTYHVVQLRPFADIATDTVHAVTWRVGVEQVGGNIALFVPLGILAYLLVELGRLRVWAALLLGPLLACGIEVAQWVLPLGRATTTDDVILASVGTLLGYGLGWLFRLPAHRTQRMHSADDPLTERRGPWRSRRW